MLSLYQSKLNFTPNCRLLTLGTLISLGAKFWHQKPFLHIQECCPLYRQESYSLTSRLEGRWKIYGLSVGFFLTLHDWPDRSQGDLFSDWTSYVQAQSSATQLIRKVSSVLWAKQRSRPQPNCKRAHYWWGASLKQWGDWEYCSRLVNFCEKFLKAKSECYC